MKCLLKLVMIGVLGVLLIVGAAVFGLESILTEAIQAGVGHATGQETALAGVDVEYGNRKLAFRELEIANPPGFQEAPMFRLGTLHAEMAPEMVRGDVILVEEILLDGLEISLELKGSDSNVQVLMDHLAEAQGEEPAAATPEPTPDSKPADQPTQKPAAEDPPASQPTAGGPASEEPKTELLIGRVQISGVKVSLHISDVPGISGQYSVTVPTIVLGDLDSKYSEAELSVWVAIVLESVLDRAFEAGKNVFPGEWQTLLESELAKSLLKGDLEGATKELEKQAAEQLDGVIEKAEEAQNLLKEGGSLLEKAGISKDPTSKLQEELKKGADLRKDFFKKD